MGQLAALEVDQHVTPQQAVVEHEIYEEVSVVEAEALLARLEQKTLAEFQQELLEPVDDRGFQFALGIGGPLLQTQELQHDRVLDKVRRFLDHMPLAGEATHLPLVAAEREPLVQRAVNLPLEFADAPAAIGGLDLVEATRVGVVDEQQGHVVGPAEGEVSCQFCRQCLLNPLGRGRPRQRIG